MNFQFNRFGNPPLDAAYVEHLLNEEFLDRTLAFERLWKYYRNEIHGLDGGLALPLAGDGWAEVARPYVQDQEFGLPARITGRSYLGYGAGGLGLPANLRRGTEPSGAAARRKEVVVENDIGWRIDTGVHFLFGKAPIIESLAPDPARAREIEALLAAVFQANGGVAFFQELALLGGVYGFADVVLRLTEGLTQVDGRWVRSGGDTAEEIDPLAAVRLEAVEASRAIPILDEEDFRTVRYYVLHYHKLLNQVIVADDLPLQQATCRVTEILGPDWWQYYEDGSLVAEGPNVLGQVPVVHIQNLPLPGRYEGAGEVEPLIPLQDELNTRLSDRASRVTFQSFKMYLGRGIENFENRPVAPGRMWSTDNPDAAIEEFGGDADSPSESAHVSELREAMDKLSGVTALTAGLINGRLGNLTSAAALKVTLMGTLARVERKRVTYGEGLARLSAMILSLVDRAGIFANTADERRVRIHWPDPLPENQREQLEQAQMKLNLGIPRADVLRELGYATKEE